MPNEKFSEEEINNIKEIDQLLHKDDEYIRIEPGSSKTLRFILSEKVPSVEKEYNGKKSIKYRFSVIDENADHREKKFDIGKIAALDIVKKIKEGHKVLNIERIGSGISTRYIARSASNTE
jgi:hypothetical protein